MNGINKAIIVGRVGQDPKITEFKNGNKCAQFSVATTERGFTTRDGREIPDKTEWHNIVCYGNLATVIQNYVRKGSSLYVEGKIRYREFTDQQNQKRYITEINADEVQLLDKREESQHQNASVASHSAPQSTNAQRTDNLSSGTQETRQTDGNDENSDDLPF